MEGANLSGLSEEPSELVTLLCKVVGKEKKNTQKEKETGMNITKKMALAQQGCSGDIKQELTGEKDDEKGALTSNNSCGRKRGRLFMDESNANFISL